MVHEFEHRPRGTERHVELRILPTQARRCHACPQQSARLVERIDVGALERIDRLLAIADGEHGALCVPRRLTGKELLGQRVCDAPLLRRGVLDFVQQQVIETAVQLVEHPGRARIDQQVGRAADQVIVIQQARCFLVPGVGIQHRRGERQERG